MIIAAETNEESCGERWKERGWIERGWVDCEPGSIEEGGRAKKSGQKRWAEIEGGRDLGG